MQVTLDYRQEFGIPATVIKNTINEILDNTFNKTLGDSF